MRILADHARGGAGDPHVVVLVEVAAVEARVEIAQVAPGMDHVAVGIDLNHRGRHAARVQVSGKHVLAVKKEDVVLGV